MPIPAPHSIAGFPARLESVALDVAESAPLRRIELFTVDGLEHLVDAPALLRADDGREPPYWALVWIGARAIAARVAVLGPGADTTVLDLGCGLGLSGLAAALLGARVLFADNSEEALAFVTASLDHHGIRSAEARRCDFTRDRMDRRFDLILAADVVYDPGSYTALVEFLDAHLAADGTLLLTESLRADARTVVESLCEHGFSDHKEGLWIEEDGKPERTWLHTMRRRG